MTTAAKDELEALALAYASLCCAAAGAILEKAPLIGPRTHWTDNGSQTEFDSGVNWRLVAALAAKTAAEQPGSLAFLEKAAAHNLTGGIDTERIDKASLHAAVLRTTFEPIAEMWERLGAARVDDDLFRSAWHRWVANWQASSAPHSLYVLLANFEVPPDAVKLSGDVFLHQLTGNLRNALWSDNHEAFNILPAHDFLRSTAVLHVRQSIPVPLAHGNAVSVHLARAAMTALRLAGSGDVEAVGTVMQWEAPKISGPLATPALVMNAPRLVFGKPSRRYKLDTARALSASALLSCLTSEPASTESGIQFALGRLEQAADRRSLEDRVVDHTIALESTLLHGVQTELGYRLALRASTLLALSHPPAMTFHTLQILYDLRSKIVHEGTDLQSITKKGKYATLDPYAFGHEIEDLTRALLRAAVQRSVALGGLSPLCAALDAEILHAIEAAGKTSVDTAAPV